MKSQTILLICLMAAFSVVNGQYDLWTGLKCGMDNQKLYDRSYNLDTCDDYCVAGKFHYGRCEINNGYGECRCFYNPYPLPPF